MADGNEVNLSCEALGLIWDGYKDGVLFETCASPRLRSHHSDLERAVGESRDSKFFGLLPRQRAGSTKLDVVTSGNVLWVDLDFGSAPALIDRVLVPRGLHPTLVISSGHGYWFIWKLSEMKRASWIEESNRALARLLGGDFCHDRARICRVPGSINEKGGRGRPVSVHSLDRTLIYKASAFRSVRDDRKARASHLDLSRITISEEDRIEGTTRRDPDFSRHPDLLAYLEGPAVSSDRSQTECRIACLLLRAGMSRGEVRGFFSDRALPRFTEDQAQGRPDLFDQMVSRIIFEWSKNWTIASPPPGPPPVSKRSGETLTRPRDLKTLASRRLHLVEVAEGHGREELIDQVSSDLGIPRKTIENDLGLLLRSRALIKKKDPADPFNSRIVIYANPEVVELVERHGPHHLMLHGYLLPGHVLPVFRSREKDDEKGLSHGA